VDIPQLNPGYMALRERAAWLDLSARGKIRAAGEDRARLLHAMTTNEVQKLKPGEGCYAFFLNAQGRILGDVNLLCMEDHFLLDTEPETRQKLFEHLDRYIIADDVTLEDQTDQLATIAVEGPEAATILAGLNAPFPQAPYATLPWRDDTIAHLNSTGSGGFFIFTAAAAKEELLQTLSAAGAVAVSPENARIVRIEHGRPRYGEEITDRYLVQETGQLHAVNFNKGCYLGQEIVERVRSRAQIHRVLRRLELDTSDVPAPGTKLKAGDADAAEIASAAFSPALGKIAALAYVRVQYAEPGTELSLDGIRARLN
jgi:folate-binding protein YgfZ